MKYSTKVLVLKDRLDYYKNQALNLVSKFHLKVYHLLIMFNVMALNFISRLKEVLLFRQICNTIMRPRNLTVLMIYS
jgi:hypothetical protein